MRSNAYSSLICRTTAAFLLAIAPLAAQAGYTLPEDPGPHGSGWQDIQFTDSTIGTGFIKARIYYPALTDGQNALPDSASGPYPLVALLHGYTGSGNMFFTLGGHLSSRGYLVAAIDTETGLFPSTEDYADDTHALLHWMEDQSADPISWLSGMANDGDWSAMGHSMGGGTLSLLIGLEPRVRSIVGMQPADHDAPGPANMAAFTGSAIFIAGEQDRIVPTRTVRKWYDRAVQAQRRIMVEVAGLGHGGPNDGSDDEPTRFIQRLATGFLDAEVLGRVEDYETFFGDMVAGHEPFDFDVDFEAPVIWGGRGRGNAMNEMGIVARPGDMTQAAWSFSLGSFYTPFGNGDLDLSPGQGGFTHYMRLGPDARVSGPVTLQAAWMGRTIYYQAAAWNTTVLGVIDGALTNVLPLVIT